MGLALHSVGTRLSSLTHHPPSPSVLVGRRLQALRGFVLVDDAAKTLDVFPVHHKGHLRQRPWDGLRSSVAGTVFRANHRHRHSEWHRPKVTRMPGKAVEGMGRQSWSGRGGAGAGPPLWPSWLGALGSATWGHWSRFGNHVEPGRHSWDHHAEPLKAPNLSWSID